MAGQTGFVECVDCGERATYEDAQCPNDIQDQNPQWNLWDDGWRCPVCDEKYMKENEE